MTDQSSANTYERTGAEIDPQQRAFEEEYCWLNPPPQREDFQVRDDAVPWMGRAWTIVFIVIASVTISGVRTASLFTALANHANAQVIQIVEGVAAIILVEVGTVLTGFRAETLRREQQGQPRHVASLRDLVRGAGRALGW